MTTNVCKTHNPDEANISFGPVSKRRKKTGMLPMTAPDRRRAGRHLTRRRLTSDTDVRLTAHIDCSHCILAAER